MKKCLQVILITLASWMPATSQQSPLNVFGYFESSYLYKASDNFSPAAQTSNLRQLNLMMNAEFDQQFSALVNLEFLNDFSTERGWGALNIEDAWVRYQYSPAFSVKAGLLVPTFNNLNEIKNRTPLLPYIIRPLVYDPTIRGILDLGDFLPERAFVQINGFVPAGDAKIDYAAYLGNSATSYITSTSIATLASGSDTSQFKLIGARVGVRVGGLKAGISSTYDRENHDASVVTLSPVWGMNTFAPLGDVPRIRLGVDFSYTFRGFTLESEFISVNHTMTDANQARLDSMVVFSTISPGVSVYTNSLAKMFYYGNLTYDFNEQWYAYGNYSYLYDKFQRVYADGLNGYSFGCGYRPTQSVVVKLERTNFKLTNTDFMDVNQTFYLAAVSVIF